MKVFFFLRKKDKRRKQPFLTVSDFEAECRKHEALNGQSKCLVSVVAVVGADAVNREQACGDPLGPRGRPGARWHCVGDPIFRRSVLVFCTSTSSGGT